MEVQQACLNGAMHVVFEMFDSKYVDGLLSKHIGITG